MVIFSLPDGYPYRTAVPAKALCSCQSFLNKFSMRCLPLMLRKSDSVKALDFTIQIHSGQTSVMSFSELVACFFMYVIIDSNNNMCRPRLFPEFSSKSFKRPAFAVSLLRSLHRPFLAGRRSLGRCPPAQQWLFRVNWSCF